MLLELIKQTIVGKNKEELLGSMGYKSPKVGLKTLNSLLEENNLISWISKSHFDYVFTSESFLKELSNELNIDEQNVIDTLNEIANYHHECDKLKNLSLFVNTNFKRTTEPIFALAFLESKRRITIDKNLLIGKSEDQVIERISNIIQAHYSENEGKLPLWGTIHTYILNAFGNEYIFDINGSLLSKLQNKESNIQKAIVSIG